MAENVRVDGEVHVVVLAESWESLCGLSWPHGGWGYPVEQEDGSRLLDGLEFVGLEPDCSRCLAELGQAPNLVLLPGGNGGEPMADSWAGGFDEWQGTVTIEVQIAVRATSGRPKHTDPEEQGAWIAEGIKQRLGDAFAASDSVQVGETKMVAHREERWTEWG